jgi:hypothetical protein
MKSIANYFVKKSTKLPRLYNSKWEVRNYKNMPELSQTIEDIVSKYHIANNGGKVNFSSFDFPHNVQIEIDFNHFASPTEIYTSQAKDNFQHNVNQWFKELVDSLNKKWKVTMTHLLGLSGTIQIDLSKKK